jgi:hypothetical protein
MFVGPPAWNQEQLLCPARAPLKASTLRAQPPTRTGTSGEPERFTR